MHDFMPAHLHELADLWVASWQAAMPQIDFEARRSWFAGHLSDLQRAGTQIVCAFDAQGAIAGVVTVDPVSGYLDQLAVAPRYWGEGPSKKRIPPSWSRSNSSEEKNRFPLSFF